MKKRTLFIFSTLLVVFLAGCNLIKDMTTNDSETPVEEVDEEDNPTFVGTIAEINGDMALVNIEEGDILSSGNQVNIPLSMENVDDFKVGDKVRIGYDGTVMESHPLQINLTSIEKIE